MKVGAGLELLGEAMTRAGIPLWHAPESVDAIDALAAAVAPMRLPSDVVEFWRRVDVGTMRVEPHPRFSPPDFALRSWQSAEREFIAFQPLTLVLVGYESHTCTSVDLDVGDTEGGALFESFISDPSGFTRRFNGLGDWLAYVAAEEQARRPVPAEHSTHGTTLHIGPDIRDWPDHWRRINGLRPEDLRPRGRTHTVAQVLDSPSTQELRCTIAACVIDLADGSG